MEPTSRNIEEWIASFDKDFREYLNASIAYAELQEPYQALSAEEEIAWIKNWLRNTLTSISSQAKKEVLKELKEFCATLQDEDTTLLVNQIEVFEELDAINTIRKTNY